MALITMANEEQPSPLEFELYITYAAHFLMPELNISLEFHKSCRITATSATTSRKSKSVKLDQISETNSTGQVRPRADSMSYSTDENVVHIVIATEYDHQNNLVSLRFERDVRVPRRLLKIIEMIIPFHPLLASIAFRGGMAPYTLHEIRNFQPKLPMLTEVVLDNVKVANVNFEVLLDDPSKIKYLSIANSLVTDTMMERVAAKLKLEPASTTLSHLNLAFNTITDIGAGYIAEALRMNRKLEYLNLSCNKVTDAGVNSIFEVLQMFLVRPDELYAKKRDHFDFLRLQAETKQSQSVAVRKIPKKSAILKLEEVEIPAFMHVFHGDNVCVVDNKTYCLGNNVLCALNIAYNNLTITTLNKLVDVIQYQKDDVRKPRGLLHLKIEGNFLPNVCRELDELNDLLDKQLQRCHNDNKRGSVPAISKKRSQGPN